jgi:hypothetical protein
MDIAISLAFLLPVLRTPLDLGREITRDKNENPLGLQPEGVAISLLISASYLRGSGCLDAHESDDVAGGNASERARDSRTTKRMTRVDRIGISRRRARGL